MTGIKRRSVEATSTTATKDPAIFQVIFAAISERLRERLTAEELAAVVDFGYHLHSYSFAVGYCKGICVVLGADADPRLVRAVERAWTLPTPVVERDEAAGRARTARGRVYRQTARGPNANKYRELRRTLVRCGRRAKSDIARATKLAATAVPSLGVDGTVGPLWFGMPSPANPPEMFMTDSAQAARVRTALPSAYSDAVTSIGHWRAAVDALTAALPEQRAVDGDEAAGIVAEYPATSAEEHAP
jgi:hypothetical protein